MSFYAIFDPQPGKPALPVAVADRFSWLACLLPPVFALRHGLWLELLGFGLLVVALNFAGLWLGSGASFWLYVILAISLGFAAPALRRGKLRRQGWAYRSHVFATHAELAQLEALQ